jgi:type II secretory pathway component PulC
MYIYEDNDLFDTYQKKSPEITPRKRDIKPVPQPPQDKSFDVKTPDKISFLKPLGIDVKGIMFTGDSSTTQAVIKDSETNKENIYSTGDKIFDAHILKIFRNSIIVLRSNGQQETIYVTKSDAEKAINQIKNLDWKSSVSQEDNHTYTVFIDPFMKQVSDLGRFIELLDLTTVFRKGRGVGVRIGKNDKNSLAHALGLKKGDIIISIDDIFTTTTENRSRIFKHITNKKEDDTIRVDFVRDQNLQTYKYLLKKVDTEKKSTSLKDDTTDESTVSEKTIKSLEDRYALNVVSDKMKRREKKAMFSYGRQNSMLKS